MLEIYSAFIKPQILLVDIKRDYFFTYRRRAVSSDFPWMCSDRLLWSSVRIICILSCVLKMVLNLFCIFLLEEQRFTLYHAE